MTIAMKVRTFEELQVWQKARSLSQTIYELTQVTPFDKDYSLKDQINRATGSIMDNIAEGFERDGAREFAQFLSIAKGSAGEVRSQLHRAKDRGHIPGNFQNLIDDISEISRMIHNLRDYLKRTEYTGTKYVREPEEQYLSTYPTPPET
jgi:four helix bundle protein